MHNCPNCNAPEEEIELRGASEIVPFAYYRNGRARENQIRVYLAVHNCKKCGLDWTDQQGEVIRDQAVQDARKELEKAPPEMDVELMLKETLRLRGYRDDGDLKKLVERVFIAAADARDLLAMKDSIIAQLKEK